jgi:hypothetical protein
MVDNSVSPIFLRLFPLFRLFVICSSPNLPCCLRLFLYKMSSLALPLSLPPLLWLEPLVFLRRKPSLVFLSGDTPHNKKKQVHVICSPYTTNPLRRQVPVNLHPGPVDPMRPFCHSMILFTVPVDSPRPPPESPLICPAAAVFNNPASTATAMQMQNIPLSCEKHLLFS